MNTDETVDPNFGGGDLCGTDTTPDCPLRAVYLERNALIYQLAGTRTDYERVRRAARRVDEYLIGVLRSAIALSRPLEHGHQEHGHQEHGHQEHGHQEQKYQEQKYQEQGYQDHGHRRPT